MKQPNTSVANVKREGPKPMGEKRPVHDWPSHTRFVDMLDFCVRGRSHPVLKSSAADDHVAELCLLHLDDVDPWLWMKHSPRDGIRARKLIASLEDRICTQADLAAAETLCAIATEATFAVLRLYLRDRALFDRIHPRRKLLPVLASIHPNTAKVSARMIADARLGTQTEDAARIQSKSWFTSDQPANVYARAILYCVSMNRNLEPVSCQQRSWRGFDRKEGVRTVVLPFPKHLSGLERLPEELTPENVLAFWRKGKEIILEELPDFHLRPEWANYRENRRYAGGAKPGAIQHAIFKDILAALRTIAGAKKSRRRKPATKAQK